MDFLLILFLFSFRIFFLIFYAGFGKAFQIWYRFANVPNPQFMPEEDAENTFWFHVSFYGHAEEFFHALFKMVPDELMLGFAEGKETVNVASYVLDNVG